MSQLYRGGLGGCWFTQHAHSKFFHCLYCRYQRQIWRVFIKIFTSNIFSKITLNYGFCNMCENAHVNKLFLLFIQTSHFCQIPSKGMLKNETPTVIPERQWHRWNHCNVQMNLKIEDWHLKYDHIRTDNGVRTLTMDYAFYSFIVKYKQGDIQACQNFGSSLIYIMYISTCVTSALIK